MEVDGVPGAEAVTELVVGSLVEITVRRWVGLRIVEDVGVVPLV